MATVPVNLTLDTLVGAISITAIVRGDTGLAVSGLSPPIAMTPGSSYGSPTKYPWSASFTDSNPPAAYEATATLTYQDGIVSQPFAWTIFTTPAPSATPLEKFYVIAPPSATPVTYADLKIPLKLDSDFEQAYVQTLIDAATDYAQDNLATSLMPQTLAAVFNAEDVELSPPVMDYPWDPLSPLGTPLGTPSFATWGTWNRSPCLRLLRGPVQSIVSVIDAGSNPVTAALQRTPIGDRLALRGTAVYPVTVTYTAGYPSASAIPAGIRVAIMAHVGTLYANRASASANDIKVVPHSLESFYRLKARRIPCG